MGVIWERVQAGHVSSIVVCVCCDEEERHLSNQGHNVIMTINLWLCIVDGTGRLKTSRLFFRNPYRAAGTMELHF